ncbi:HAMP domain-containing histidine kinase [Paenibacillus tritici]|uniref:histidine kinase n=1 Tax=Paenibacillus tritici TaxID=1873425 RepID=A0ABX2DJM3_9BACL|nr:HAMP domain-containing sensor histidine kinase [Paenibacillus tritici]NQX44268.1 HAMP domain-containing histidine kinase [Paenibacillus tritici]QUL57883.1 HAMP domain-containing histidine kinase [Paenibacillus tritici]
MKHPWKSRDNRPLQSSLTIDFLLFNCMLLMLVLVVYLFVQKDITQVLRDRMTPDPDLSVEAGAYRDELGQGPESKRLLRSGGWLELLDSGKQVIRVVGDKQDDTLAYDENSLYQGLENRSDQPYYYSITSLNEDSGAAWLLLKIPRDVIKVSINNELLVAYLNHSVFFYVFLVSGLVLLLIFVYSYWVSRRIKKPLRVLNQGMNRMMEGHYNTRITLYAETEFLRIGNSFNYMADVIEKTTEEKRQAEKSKQRLMVDLSHDLKTPITSIQGYAQALIEGRVTDPKRQTKYLNYIYTKSVQVTKLIQHMLDLLKLDSPDFILRIERLELGGHLREIIADTYGEIEQKSFELQLQVPEEAVYARYDPELFASVINNLISNALAYNPEGTRIRVSVIPEDTEIRIEIADNGVGIPKELWSTIFDPFVRGDEARTTASGGTGLGLSIAKKNVEKMEGTLVLESREEEPSVFVIRIPK